MSALTHPEWVNGRRLWIEGPMSDVIDKLNNGDPAKGWEGDPNLAVYYIPESERWEILRLEETGRYELVCRSKPGVPFHDGVIDMLMTRDQKYRKLDLHQEVVEHNEAMRAAEEREFDERMTEFAERFAYGVRKDMGY